MVSGLLVFPRELMEQVVQNLPAESIHHLRLASKGLSIATTGPHFYSLIRRQTINLTPKSLDSLEALIKYDAFNYKVRHVRIMAETFAVASLEHILATGKTSPPEMVLENWLGGDSVVQLRWPLVQLGEEELRKRADDLSWMKAHLETHEELLTSEEGEQEVVNRLVAIFRQLKDLSLDTIELDARFVSGPRSYSRPVAREMVDLDRQLLWARASQLYRLTLTALARSQVAVPNLQILSHAAGCSIPSYDITAGIPGLLANNAGVALAGIKQLAFSFSNRMDHGWERLERVYGSDAGKRERRRQRLQWAEIWDDVYWSDLHGVASEPGSNSGQNTDDSDWDSDDSEYDARIAADKNSEIRGRYSDIAVQAICRDNFPGFAQLLQQMRNLESLDVHMYQTLVYESNEGRPMYHYYYKVFNNVIDQGLRFQHLKHVALSGLWLRPDSLVAFMQGHLQVTSLELQNVGIPMYVSGQTSWGVALAELAQDAVAQRSALASVFCSYLGSEPQVSGAISSNSHNFLRVGEPIRDEWLHRGWVSRWQKGVFLSGRRVLRDEFTLEDAFGQGRSSRRGGLVDVPDSRSWGMVEAQWEDRYGRNYH
ncbi:hypothetical protein B0J18DRAFT_438370 [Chaetomium sp. MPI-SDFR-AT-0129]|nr:hypothetical protein B0J18DRAFT_438370 [Chaetomium sp. MPI-SDFR-AT-0129]